MPARNPNEVKIFHNIVNYKEQSLPCKFLHPPQGTFPMATLVLRRWFLNVTLCISARHVLTQFPPTLFFHHRVLRQYKINNQNNIEPRTHVQAKECETGDTGTPLIKSISSHSSSTCGHFSLTPSARVCYVQGVRSIYVLYHTPSTVVWKCL